MVTAGSTLTPSAFGQKIFLTAQLTNALGGVNGGFVTFFDGGAPLAVIPASFSTVSFADTSLPAGTHSITASYSGNSDFGAASSATFTQVILPALPINYSLASDKPSATLLAGQAAKFLVSGTSVSGFNGSIKFGCNNLPAFTTCTFSPSSIFVAPGTPTVSVQLTVKTSGPNASLSAPPTPWTKDHGLYASLWSLGPVCFGIVLVASSRRRKSAGALVLGLAALILVLAVSGCGGGGSTPPPPPPPPNITPSGTTAMAVTTTGTPTAGSANATNPNQTLNISITVQ
jgi:hypothetical protein